MPWTVADVESHKKGCSPEQKKQWVRVANSVLSKCIADGGTDATCAPSAIRQANGVVGNGAVGNTEHSVILNKKKQKEYSVREAQHQGKKHLIVPVTMMVEGVHNGSNGPILHTATELGRFIAAWNGIPVVIDHPEVEGENISANAPDVIDARAVGRVYNATMDGTRLRAEAWLDEEKLRTVSAVALDYISNGRPLEVSVGVFSDNDETSGEWHGEQYEAIATNLRPDHLALLPGGVGACSWSDGCGVRVNQMKGGNDVTINEDQNLKDQMVQRIIEANADGGFKAIVDAARNKIDSMDSDSVMHYLEEVYEDHIVYTARMRMGGTKTYKQQYELKDALVEFTGNPVEVTKKVEFVPINNSTGKLTRLKFNNKKEVNTMGEIQTCSDCVKKKVDALIASGRFTEADRPGLEANSEELLDKIAKPVETVVEKVVEKTVEVNKLTDDQKKALEYGERQLKAYKAKMVATIQANAKDVWTDVELNAMDDAALEKMVKAIDTKKSEESVTDFSLNAGFQVNHSIGDEPLYPTGIEMETKK